MKKFTIFFLSVTLLSCSNSSNEPVQVEKASNTASDLGNTTYKQLVDGLKLNYVLYYRSIKEIDSNLNSWGMPTSDSIFRIDSIRYWKSNEKFFKQDRDFVTWLLSFKYDTTNSGLWIKYHNPISSYLSECNLPGLVNSRSVIILLENFLTGYKDELECFECKYDNGSNCNFDKYDEIEAFLSRNKKKSIAELRTLWRRKNDH
ncbi:hypothetical protein [Foetidibacter luteolus]|uniref:hypothetical protein n=1 Tax=Foetidibacter luteolus TaxID=2608880 RepID=UPI00129B6055|nr:hypothetical protein [Foetidibacter luteolus]